MPDLYRRDHINPNRSQETLECVNMASPLGSQFRDKVRSDADINIDPPPRYAMTRVRNMYVATKEAYPDLHEEGMQWYNNVHDAIRKSGLGVHRGAGIVAAVSPNMDFETNNIKALDDIQNLGRRDWKMINDTAGMKKRPAEVAAMLSEKAPSLGHAPASGVVKAGRILHGENYNDVLEPQSAPKTNAFAHNLEHPEVFGKTTIDGRQADIVVDAMRPWGSPKNKDGKYPEGTPKPNRNIGSADLKSGKETRYERYQGYHSTVAHELGIKPHELQAVTWTMGKQVERKFDPARSKGDPRRGQSYQNRVNHFLDGVGYIREV